MIEGTSPRQEWYDSDYVPDGHFFPIRNLRGEIVGGRWEGPFGLSGWQVNPSTSLPSSGLIQPVSPANQYGVAMTKGHTNVQPGQILYLNGKAMGVVLSATHELSGNTRIEFTSQQEFNRRHKIP